MPETKFSEEWFRHRSLCAIEGCAGSTGAPRVAWICSKHWRTACPPGSPERRAYNRVWRLYRKAGRVWTPDLERKFWVVWNGIVRRGSRRVRGDIDKAEIDALFGWVDD
jgi:hypothetical protein